MSSKENLRKEIRRDIKHAADVVRREMSTFKKDLLTDTENWKKSTEKFVLGSGPKVSKALDEMVTKTGDVFDRTMVSVEKQARETQVDLLRAYRSILNKQVQLIDQRLKKRKK